MSEERRAFAVQQNSDGTLNVLAQVNGDSAQRMIENAGKNGTEVVQDSSLAQSLEEAVLAQEAQAWDLMSVIVSEIEGFIEELDSGLEQGKNK